MAYVITDGCVSCGTCAGECPVGAISEGDGKYVSTLILHRVRNLRCCLSNRRYRRLIISYIRKPQSICFVVFFLSYN